MYHLVFSTFLLLASCLLSHSRTVFISKNGAHSYLPYSSESDVCTTPSCVIAAADILTSIDETVDPCDDFYGFSCGGWMKRHEVSEDQPVMNLFSKTRKDLYRKLRELLESDYESSEPPFVKMLKDYYNSCVDIDTIEKQGSEPLKKMLHRLGGWPVVEGSQWDESRFDWVDTMISLRKVGYNPDILLELSVRFDPRNKTVSMLWLEDPAMGRFRRANLTDGLNDNKIAAYYKMMVKAAKLLEAEESTAENEMLEALYFEIALKNITKSTQYLDVSGEERNKTLYTVTKLQNELPQVPWLKVINGLLLIDEVSENYTFVSRNPDFLEQFAHLITSTEKRVIANYMLWRAVQQSKDYLSEEWKDINEDECDPWIGDCALLDKLRWKRCLKLVGEKMHIGLASYYVRHYFNDESKDEATILLKYIRKEFLKMLDENDWMDEKTREKAEQKAEAIKAFIGYPKELMNDTFMMQEYENLSYTGESYLENYLINFKWDTDKQLTNLRKSYKEVKEMRYTMKYEDITEVNAYYNPRENSIAIPAGILHGAIYDKDRPKYMNFAVIGFVIGHEITHGFDNNGRKYDKDGNYVNWWDEESDEHFIKKMKCIVEQYDNYTTDIGWKVNGDNTRNENIADNGGLKEAYRAYHAWIKDHGTEPLLPGMNYTQNQLFWLSTAHSWCSMYETKKLKEMILTNFHSPGKFRIIGPMSNLAEFSKDFNCPADAPMNRKYKCEVW